MSWGSWIPGEINFMSTTSQTPTPKAPPVSELSEMAALTEKIIARAASQQIEKEVADHEEIYRLRYKKGAIIREENFLAKNPDHAFDLAKKYISYLLSKENTKIILIGKPEKFCLDIEKEISGESQKQASPDEKGTVQTV